jgi:flagellum-specific ATP synthase
MNYFSRAEEMLTRTVPVNTCGYVTDITGLIIEGSGPAVGIGTTCTIVQDSRRIAAQVVGFRKGSILLMSFDDVYGIAPGATIISQGEISKVLVSRELLGRVIDPLGKPLDSALPLALGTEVPVFQNPPSPLKRDRIEEVFDVGIKAVNSMLSIGKGQRVAIMAGSGVGKSTFLSMIAKHSKSSINVIALVGERGREVREFIERDLGPEGMARSVIVTATSDSSALLRIRAGFVATAIAEYFRDQGEDVCLMLDSITRFCMAQREIGLAVGEPPSTNGYTPSVFAILPKLLERAGCKAGAGSITAFYTVLVEGDDMNEPIADAVRGILDGHIVLSRALANTGHYPAIDILQSVSRVMSDIVPAEKIVLAQEARKVLADYKSIEDLVTAGAYKEGQNKTADYALAHIEEVHKFLKQKPLEAFSVGRADELLGKVFK